MNEPTSSPRRDFAGLYRATVTPLRRYLTRFLRDSAEAEETIDAIGDHNEIRDGIRAASLHDVGSNGWWQGVIAARKANDEHMGEEEHEGLRDFRRHIDLETRHKIAVAFISYEAEPDLQIVAFAR